MATPKNIRDYAHFPFHSPLRDKTKYCMFSIYFSFYLSQDSERESEHNALYFWGGQAKTSPEMQKLFC